MQNLTTLPALAAQAYDALALPVWLFSSETLNIVAANKAAQTWLGYDEQTLKTMTVADLRPESERELVADRVRRFNDVQGHAGTWTIVAKSGNRYTVSFHWTKVLFDGAPTIVASIQDITQATQVQAHARTLAANILALQTKVTLTTEHFARLFDAVPGKMLVLTPNNYTIVAVTDDYAKAVSSDRTTLIGRRLFEAFPDDPNEPEADGTRNLMASLQRAQTLNTTDVMAIQRYPVRTPDGTFQERFWLPLNKPVFDNQGKLLYIIHRVEDVTTELGGPHLGDAAADAAIPGAQRNLQLNQDETRATLLALKEREAQLRQTLESISDAFYLLDNNWHFRFLNKHAEKLVQRRSADLLGKLIWTEFPDVVGTIFQTEYERAVREQQTVHFQNFYPALETWFDVSAYPTPQGLAVYFRDITRHKRDQQALQINEERFRLVARATGNAVWEIDVTTGHQWWSEGLNEIFGHAPDSAKALQAVWDMNVHPEDKQRLEAALNKVIAGEQTGFSEQYRFRRADGSWATIEDRAFGVRNHEGQVVRVLGNITDISEQLQLERRLQQAQKMEAVGQLTGGVAHDFNNLLTVILGNSEVLSDELAGRPDLQSIAQMISKAGARGAELTNRLLAFSRRQALQPRVTHIGTLIQGMEDLLKRTLPETIDIVITHADSLWNAEIDPGQLESALLNLTLNARDAMPDGGCLTIETSNAELDRNYTVNEPEIEPGHYVQIVVTDTGLGIPADTLGRIFEPFFTTKDVGKGSGLGLSMVYGFVKQSGGHVRVYSEPGEGTSFKLYFPRSYAQDEPAPATDVGQTISGGKETILVVEDDPLVRTHVISLLKGLGYQVMHASNGAEALALIEGTHSIDLLFTDVVMPGGMGGRALAESALLKRPGLKVLFTSGYTQNSIIHNGKLDPGVDLLGKPYRREQLALKLREVLDRR